MTVLEGAIGTQQLSASDAEEYYGLRYARWALEIQPDYAAAWSGLAVAYGGAAMVGALKPQEAWPQAEAATARALELDDHLPDAHNANAANFLFYRWDFIRAEQESARAIELGPNFAEAYHLRSYTLNALNRTDEALEAQRRATELDPFAKDWALGMELLRLRRFDEAAEDARNRIAARPNDASAHDLLSDVYRLQGKKKESVEELEKAVRFAHYPPEGLRGIGALIVLVGFFSAGGAAAAGWTGYAPLTDTAYEPGVGLDLWIVGLAMVGISSVLGAINLISTIFGLRAPGMGMFRMPIFTWNILVTSILILFAFPPLTAAFAMLFIERNLGGVVFDPAHGGDAILWQHIFWFFGHPEVYILILPFFGVITEIISVFSRKPVFGYAAFVLATVSIASLSMAVWAHHMFTTGAVDLPFFALMSFAIAVPTGIKFFNWIGTMWGGHLTFETPMLWALGFLYLFLIGGITGIILASPALDFNVQDTYFVVAHFHNTLIGGTVFAIFAATYYWFPKMTGRRLSEPLGRLHFVLWVVGFTLTFLPMYQLGADGMPRRIASFDPKIDFLWRTVVGTPREAAGVL
jgi:hypothetical protein